MKLCASARTKEIAFAAAPSDMLCACEKLADACRKKAVSSSRPVKMQSTAKHTEPPNQLLGPNFKKACAIFYSSDGSLHFQATERHYVSHHLGCSHLGFPVPSRFLSPGQESLHLATEPGKLRRASTCAHDHASPRPVLQRFLLAAALGVRERKKH